MEQRFVRDDMTVEERDQPLAKLPRSVPIGSNMLGGRLGAQLRVKDLADRGLRQAVADLDRARALEFGQPRHAVRLQLVRRHRLVRLQDDEGLDHLAVIRVRHADRRRFHHRRMRIQRRLRPRTDTR